MFYYNYAFIIINIENINGTVSLENNTFLYNCINSQILNIEKISFLIMNNLECIGNNPNFDGIGGCFRTKNILYRKITNMTIMNCFSKQTTPGIKFIDTFISELIKEFQAVSLPYVFILNFKSILHFLI